MESLAPDAFLKDVVASRDTGTPLNSSPLHSSLAAPEPMPARLPIRLHLSDQEESAALSNASTPKKARTKGDDGIGSKLAWSPTGEEFTIAIARGSSLQREHVPVLEGE